MSQNVNDFGICWMNEWIILYEENGTHLMFIHTSGWAKEQRKKTIKITVQKTEKKRKHGNDVEWYNFSAPTIPFYVNKYSFWLLWAGFLSPELIVGCWNSFRVQINLWFHWPKQSANSCRETTASKPKIKWLPNKCCHIQHIISL